MEYFSNLFDEKKKIQFIWNSNFFVFLFKSHQNTVKSKKAIITLKEVE